MHDNVAIIRTRQSAIRREVDRRGLAWKAVAYDSQIPYETLLTYFPNPEGGREPAQIPGGAIYALCEGQALPADLLSMLLPEGFQIVRVPEGIDHVAMASWAADYLVTKNAAHDPLSECAEAIGPTEQSTLDSKVARFPLASAA